MLEENQKAEWIRYWMLGQIRPLKPGQNQCEDTDSKLDSQGRLPQLC